LIIAAEKTTPEIINFFRHGSLRLDLHADHTGAGTAAEPALDGSR
jgi:hypothetical protein